jgi:hypothetical protein
MSDDLSIVFRRDGVDHFAYTRWGASSLGRDLLAGPNAVEAFVTSLPERTSPFLERWMCGLAVIDFDARDLAIWASQFGWGCRQGHKLVFRLLDRIWEGWAVSWMTDPWRFICDRLPAYPAAANDPVHRMSVGEFERLQNEKWEAERDEPGVVDWI